MNENIKIRRFRIDDAPAVFELNSALPMLSPWSLSVYQSLEEAGLKGWIAEAEDAIAGFLITRSVSGELEILNLAAAPQFRRRGVASALLTAACHPEASRGIRRIFLEVRASNAGAISFYKAAGFRPTGRRRGYYSAPVEDALLMACELEK